MNDEAIAQAPARLADVQTLCRRKLADTDLGSYYSLLFLSNDRRAATIPLYAFWLEVREVVDECTDPLVAQTKLAWWHEELQRAFAQQPRHPVTIALSPVIAAHQLPRQPFLDVLEELARRATVARYASFDELREHAIRTRGRIALLAAVVGGLEDSATAAYVTSIGAALELTALLRDAGADARRGRIYLPEDELRRFGVSADEVHAGRGNEAFRAFMAFAVTQALDQLDHASTQLPRGDRTRQLPLLIEVEIARALLAEIQHDNYRVLEHKLQLTPLRQLWIAWRTVWRERRRATRDA